MDPNATLVEIRELINLYDKAGALSPASALELVTRIESLDNWLTGGGFHPSDWA